MADEAAPLGEILKAEEIALVRDGGDSFSLRVRGGGPLRDVRVVNPLPLDREMHYASFLDRKGKELATVRLDGRVSPRMRALIEEAIARHRLRAFIRRIRGLDIAGNSFYFQTETDRGAREFVVKNLSENILHPGPGHVIIIDAHENRYEIPDVAALDLHSRRLLHSFL